MYSIKLQKYMWMKQSESAVRRRDVVRLHGSMARGVYQENNISAQFLQGTDCDEFIQHIHSCTYLSTICAQFTVVPITKSAIFFSGITIS